MKKSFISLTLVVFSVSGVFAQGISGGLKAGANFANQMISGDGYVNFSPEARTSLHLGLFLTVMVSETFGLQPELMYNSVGHKFDLGSSGNIVEKISYLTVPVMLRYHPVSIFNIHAGPTFGFMMSAETEHDGDSQDKKNSYKGIDLGLGLGAGVDLPLGLGFSARYVFGLSNVAAQGPNEPDAEVTNNVIQISASYRVFGK